LDRGVGHVLGSSLPVGGLSTHTVLSAHSGMASQRMFTDLDQLVIGDVFYLQVLGQTLAYQIDAINTVLPHETELLQITKDVDACTLVTCTPYGINTHRLLVHGIRIPYEEAEIILEETVQEVVVSTWQRQYVRGLIVGLVCALGLGLEFFFAWLIWRSRYG
jgi:sortase A